ncbi:MAG: glycosyltransferase family 2 protein, partial [Alphaproteobacteria bacterium]|nr:glycosyltransferase family 2 protein [Alphaproteobacteria bacterium]
MNFATILGLMSFALWLVLLLYRGRYWEDAAQASRRPNPLRPKFGRPLPTREEPSDSPAAALPEVVIIVPVLNNGRNIRRVLSSLLAQDYPNLRLVILVDQQSSDSSLEIARTIVPNPADSPFRTLHLLPHSPLPPEWSSRTWALSQALIFAKNQSPTAELVWIADPETLQGSGMLRSLVQMLELEGRDMVSIMPELPVTNLIERITVPAYHYFFSLVTPYNWVNDPVSRSAAAGSSILLRRASFERIGGIIPIVGEDENTALAAAIKAIGTIKIANSDQAVSIKTYDTMADLRKLLALVVPVQQKHPIFTHSIFMGGLLLGFIAPPLLVIFASGVAQFFGFLTWVM